MASHEVLQAEAAEMSAKQRYDEVRGLTSEAVEERHDIAVTTETNLVLQGSLESEQAIAAIEDENEAVQREVEAMMAEIRGLHEEVQSPGTVPLDTDDFDSEGG